MGNQQKHFRLAPWMIGALVLIVISLAFQAYVSLQEVPSFLNNFKVAIPNQFTILDDSHLEFLMDYPSTWNLLPLPYGNHGDTTAKVSVTTSTGIAVDIHEMDTAGSPSLGELIQDEHTQEQARAKAIGRQIIYAPVSTQEIQIGDAVGLLSDFTSENRGNTVFDNLFGPSEPVVVEELGFQTRGKSYIVSFQATQSAYPELRNTFQHMRESIKLRSN